MSIYAAGVTAKGIELFAKILANKATLVISRAMVGSGTMPDGMTIASMTDLVQPVAAATSDTPRYKKDTVSFTIQYRSDLNGGLETEFYIKEFGVYVRDPTDDNNEVLVFYGNLGAYPQHVSRYVEGEAIDILNYPVSITVGEGQNVTVEYDPTALLNSSSVVNIFNTDIYPTLMEDVKKLIAEHNASETAHPDIRNLIAELQSQIAQLKQMYLNEVNKVQFVASFEDLEKVIVTGVWNEEQQRMEF